MILQPPASTLFPYTTLFRSLLQIVFTSDFRLNLLCTRLCASVSSNSGLEGGFVTLADRKSTRLNSSHSQISYAVFCLKKKKMFVWTGQARQQFADFLRDLPV